MPIPAIKRHRSTPKPEVLKRHDRGRDRIPDQRKGEDRPPAVAVGEMAEKNRPDKQSGEQARRRTSRFPATPYGASTLNGAERFRREIARLVRGPAQYRRSGKGRRAQSSRRARSTSRAPRCAGSSAAGRAGRQVPPRLQWPSRFLLLRIRGSIPVPRGQMSSIQVSSEVPRGSLTCSSCFSRERTGTSIPLPPPDGKKYAVIMAILPARSPRGAGQALMRVKLEAAVCVEAASK